jgi:hypothetical protein
MLAGGEMLRKILFPIALFMILVFLAYCGGAGPSSEPAGVNPGQPSIVQLLSVQQIVQTNSNAYLKAKVLDGNGRAVPNVPVTFTNLSAVGVLSSNQAVTDSLGFATVALFSTNSGFATVQAEVNTGAGKVRDKKTVFFSIFDLTIGTTTVPTLTLDVDNNNDGSFNDPSDFTFFDPADPRDEALIRATVLDATGSPVLNDTVTFGADTTEATFPDGKVKQTNSAGEAFVRLKVVPSELRNFTVPLNVNAVSTKTGAFNVITLFIGPITINSVTVSADPQSVDSAGDSTITAIVTTAAGTFVPDGTTVNFVSNKGNITPFAQTTKGIATATFTAPTVTSNTTATITASAGGKSGMTTVTIIAPPPPTPTPTPTPTPVPALVVAPATASIPCAAGTSATFFITGGKSPFTVTKTVSTDPLTIGAVSATGSFTVTTTGTACTVVPAGSSTDFSVVVRDSSSPAQLFTVTVTVTNP